MRSIARHSPELSQRVSKNGAIEALVYALNDMDASVKEHVTWVISEMASQSKDLAHAIVDSEAVPLLILCAQVISCPLPFTRILEFISVQNQV